MKTFLRIRRYILSMSAALAVAVTAFGATEIKRELVQVTLPEGWSARPPSRGIAISEEPARDGPGSKSEVVVLNGRRVACSIEMREMHAGDFIYFATHGLNVDQVYRNAEPKRFASWAGREGHGVTYVRRLPDGLFINTRDFIFHDNGFACKVSMRASDRDLAVTENLLRAALPDMDAILRSLRVRDPD